MFCVTLSMFYVTLTCLHVLFQVSITCDTQCYRIAVNGTHMFTYNHRYFLFEQIDILEVEGNISVSSVVV